jgi:hypothetical protein
MSQLNNLIPSNSGEILSERLKQDIREIIAKCGHILTKEMKSEYADMGPVNSNFTYIPIKKEGDLISGHPYKYRFDIRTHNYKIPEKAYNSLLDEFKRRIKKHFRRKRAIELYWRLNPYILEETNFMDDKVKYIGIMRLVILEKKI